MVKQVNLKVMNEINGQNGQADLIKKYILQNCSKSNKCYLCEQTIDDIK